MACKSSEVAGRQPAVGAPNHRHPISMGSRQERGSVQDHHCGQAKHHLWGSPVGGP